MLHVLITVNLSGNFSSSKNHDFTRLFSTKIGYQPTSTEEITVGWQAAERRGGNKKKHQGTQPL